MFNYVKLISILLVIGGIIGFFYDAYYSTGGAYEIVDMMFIFGGLWLNKNYGKKKSEMLNSR